MIGGYRGNKIFLSYLGIASISQIIIGHISLFSGVHEYLSHKVFLW